jgi:predicted MFS family arabinose efflux permease
MSVANEFFASAHAGDGGAPVRYQNPGRALLAVCLADFGAMTGFYLLFPVVPSYAVAVGASTAGAGLVTGALMLATVAAELAMPWLSARFGCRLLFALGRVLMGAPALLLGVATDIAAILAVSVLRGFGLGVVLVAGSSLVASVMPADRRGEALGLYGVSSGVPAIVALPLGPWLVAHCGYAPLFVAGALASLAGLAAVLKLPGNSPQAIRPLGILAGMCMPAMLGPSIVLLSVALATGVVTTFLPLVFAPAPSGLIALALLAHAVAALVARWVAGRYGDRLGQARLLSLGTAASALGVAVLAFADGPIAITVAMMLIGGGFGIVQNATLCLMFGKVPACGYDMVSAVWNLAYDAGLGLGAAAFGVISGHTGYAAALAITAALVLAALGPARLAAKRTAATGLAI